MRNTCAPLSISSCSFLRSTAMRSVPVPARSPSMSPRTSAAGSSGSGTNSAVWTYFTAFLPARLPKTLMSRSELVPRRFEPWTDTHAHSPAAYRPGTTVVLFESTCGVVVRRDAAHRVVRGRHDRHRLDDRVDAEVRAGELGDVGELGLEHLGAQVRAVQQHVVAVRAGAATFGDLLLHAAADDVAGGEVLDRGGVALHEALAARRCAGSRPRRGRPR